MFKIRAICIPIQTARHSSQLRTILTQCSHHIYLATMGAHNKSRTGETGFNSLRFFFGKQIAWLQRQQEVIRKYVFLHEIRI